MAFLFTSITGNTSFGGYISVDGEKAFPIQDDMTYELADGKHHIQIFNKSNAERGYGKFQHGVSSMKSNYTVTDALIDTHADGCIGDFWSFDVILDHNDCVVVSVTSRGNDLVGDPMYEIRELDQKEADDLREQFEKIRNTPRRNKKQIGWGIGLMAAGAFGAYNALSSGVTELSGVAIFGVLLVVGAILLYLGMKKKVRN